MKRKLDTGNKYKEKYGFFFYENDRCMKLFYTKNMQKIVDSVKVVGRSEALPKTLFIV